MTVLSARDRQSVAESVGAALQGGRAPRDDRFRSPDDAAFIRDLAAEASAQLEGRSAQAVLGWAADVLPRFAVTSSFGAESAVLLHLLVSAGRDVPVIFLDTGYHFDETIDYRRELARKWNLSILDVHPDYSPEQQDRIHGRDLFRADPDACCRMRKTVPLRRALANADGWASGVRRVQTPQRASTPVVEARQLDGRWVTKVAPLATWTDDDVIAYQREHHLPPHPLTTRGYASIGCEPCTFAVAPGDDPRAGRWAGLGKTECGVHTADDSPDERRESTPG
jgi:phosphoadenosine phosphosulfate reductase